MDSNDLKNIFINEGNQKMRVHNNTTGYKPEKSEIIKSLKKQMLNQTKIKNEAECNTIEFINARSEKIRKSF